MYPFKACISSRLCISKNSLHHMFFFFMFVEELWFQSSKWDKTWDDQLLYSRENGVRWAVILYSKSMGSLLVVWIHKVREPNSATALASQPAAGHSLSFYYCYCFMTLGWGLLVGPAAESCSRIWLPRLRTTLLICIINFCIFTWIIMFTYNSNSLHVFTTGFAIANFVCLHLPRQV